MGVLDLVAALAVLGLMREYDAMAEARQSRREEAFVPFNLPPLPQRGQLITCLAEEATSCVAVATSALHA
jgi:hypothetical protein